MAARTESAKHLDGQLDRLGRVRLLVFGAGLVIAWLALVSQILSPWWLALPVVLFPAVLIRYDRIWRAWRRAGRAIRYYERAMERLNDNWHGKGIQGRQYLQEDHLYSLDLDLFGKGSLFERICSARTQPGERTLAEWFRRPASADEVHARQQAVQELSPRLDLREDIALLGAEVPPIHVSGLIEWGTSPTMLRSVPIRILILALSLINVVTVFLWLAAGYTAICFAVSALISCVVVFLLSGRVSKVLEPIEQYGRELFLLAGLLARLERESFQTPLLNELHAALMVESSTPSWQIGRLAGLTDWLNSMKNQFFLPLALLLLWRTQMAFLIESWRSRSGRVIGQWLDAVGAMEALSSLAGFAFENPAHTFPEIVTDGAELDGSDLGHPLLPKERCVCNDVKLHSAGRVMIVSGSNMSGKSTLLRTVGTNTVLALAGAPVRATRLSLSQLSIVATLRIQDSLMEGHSRFFAEITRIRRLLEESERNLPVLFLLDELFHGTNSHDRGIGAEALLKRLLSSGAIGLLTTHDLTLTRIADRLGEKVVNVHFADQFIDGKMHFDYKMRPGIVPHSNALALMRAIGLKV